MMSAASMTSRKTMTAVASMIDLCSWLLDGQLGGGFLLMVFVEEVVGAGIERADVDGDRAAAGHHLLGIEVFALELGRGRVEILHRHLDAGVGRNRGIGGGE